MENSSLLWWFNNSFSYSPSFQCEEKEAFELLKHLMFRRKMRANYLPDMKQFQLQLYQLSRLIRDQLPDLYKWLDANEVSPTLYAAPWILTVFSSQFPLGFVTRIFGEWPPFAMCAERFFVLATLPMHTVSIADLLFLESSEVVFRVAIKLLEIHQYELMKRDNFEDIMNYMKGPIPDIDAPTMDKIMRDVFTMDVKKHMAEYQVEYNVLQEEITTSQHYMESLNREKENYAQLESKYQVSAKMVPVRAISPASMQTKSIIAHAQHVIKLTGFSIVSSSLGSLPSPA